jgi:hypothetical protein
LGEHPGAVNIPHGTSGTNNPQGILSWKCRITAASALGIEIANGVPKSGTRLDPIIIAILVSSLHAMEALALRSFFELDLLKK